MTHNSTENSANGKQPDRHGTFMQGLKTPVGLERSAKMLGKLGIGVLSTKRAATKTGWIMCVSVTAASTKMEPGLIGMWTCVVLAEVFPQFESFQIAVQVH